MRRAPRRRGGGSSTPLYGRLREAPSQPLSVDRVARLAGVARSTVYLAFGSRAGLFDALRSDLLERSGLERLIEAVRIPTPASTCVAASAAAARCSPPTATSSGRSSPCPRWTTRPWRARCAAAGRSARAAWLASPAGLRSRASCSPASAPSSAADVLWLLTGFDAFDQLYTARGLSLDEVVEILTETAERSLLRSA